MGRHGSGVEAREKSIRLTFSFEGRSCKETIKTDGKPMPPTPKNLVYAHKLAAEIRDKIRHGTFSYADYFPASPNATTGVGTSVADQLDLWYSVQKKESSTLKGYRIAKDWWKKHIGSKPLKGLKHSDILAALSTEPTWSGKTRNNKTSVLRLVLALAIKDGLISTSPIEGLESAPHQRKKPDPFSMAETEAILKGLHDKYGPELANYFGVKFYTGLRTSESLALKWESIDWRLGQMLVSEAIVLGEHKDNTKTNVARLVELNPRALAYLKAQKAHSFLLKDGWVFPDPKTHERWVDDWTPREMYWRPTLKRLGIRYRSPYQTRHTYATMMLMAGMKPAFGAGQLGHSTEMFLRTYAKWIDGGHNAVEMGKLAAFLGEQSREESGKSKGSEGSAS
jgi:integrase